MAKEFDFSGIWHSDYHYRNSMSPDGAISKHDVKIYQTGNQVVMQSVPNKEGSYLLLRLTLDGNLLTGTWNEETSPSGDYEGQIYYGAVQLLIQPDGKSIKGKHASYNHEMEIISGDWELTRTDKTE